MAAFQAYSQDVFRRVDRIAYCRQGVRQISQHFLRRTFKRYVTSNRFLRLSREDVVSGIFYILYSMVIKY